MVETAVYKHIVTFFQTASTVHVGYYRKARENQKEVDVVINFPKEKILCEVKYRNDASIAATDAIVSLTKEDGSKKGNIGICGHEEYYRLRYQPTRYSCADSPHPRSGIHISDRDGGSKRTNGKILNTKGQPLCRVNIPM